MPDKVIVEVWECKGKTEVHLFEAKKPNHYIMGFNNEYFSYETIGRFLEENFDLFFEWPKDEV